MNLTDIRFPRLLEAEGVAETVRETLAVRTVKLWPNGDLDVARITVGEPLKKALQKAGIRGQLCYGFEAISARLENEKKGILNARGPGAFSDGRISRLLLFSDDGAERLYRHIELLIQAHAPRLLGCFLDMDCVALGKLITGRDRRIKIVMVERKEAVSEVLRALIVGQAGARLQKT